MQTRLKYLLTGGSLALLGGCIIPAPPPASVSHNQQGAGQEVVVVEQQAPAQHQQPQVVVVEQQAPVQQQPQVVVVQRPAQQPQQVVVQQPQPQQVVVQPQPQRPQVVVQPSNPGGSNFGTVALRPGFMPDPHIVEGTSGGPMQASQIAGANCRGSITQRPDHIFVAQGGYSMLKILASSTQDTTLIVRTPSGQFLCDDDGGEGVNPMIQGQFGAGTYQIWVGSYRQGTNHPYRLGFTEMANVTTSSLGVSGRPAVQVQTNVPAVGPSNYGHVSLRPGFVPDPHNVRGVSGGSMPASNLGGQCRGFISQRPDHTFRAQGNFNILRVMARSNADTTLVVRDAQGRVFCDDDSGGNRNPMVVLQPMSAGNYDVWIGSYQRGTNARYTLGFSELDRRPHNLPAP